MMRQAFLNCCLFAFAALGASLPQPEFVDAGACTNVALSALPASGVLSFSLSFSPGLSNNVEVAFGVDIGGNGKLSPDERRMEAGWDRGAWFMRGAGVGGEMGEVKAKIDGTVLKLR